MSSSLPSLLRTKKTLAVAIEKMAPSIVLAHAPFASSPLNPSSPTASPQRQPRQHRTRRGTKPTPVLSPTQRLLRNTAAEAWMARRRTLIDLPGSTAKGLLDDGDLASARLITISIDEARSLEQLDKIIRADGKGMESEEPRFNADMESSERASPKTLDQVLGPWVVLTLPDKFTTMTISGLAAVTGSVCLHGLACVHNFLTHIGTKLS